MTLSPWYNDGHGTMAAAHSPDTEWEWAHVNLHQEDTRKKVLIGKNLAAKAKHILYNIYYINTYYCFVCL